MPTPRLINSGDQGADKPSAYYSGGFFFRGQQPANVLNWRDESGNANDALLDLGSGVSEDTYRANANYMTFPGAQARQALRVPKARVAPDFKNTATLLSFEVNMAAPAATVHLMGDGYTTTDTFFRQGIVVGVASSGKMVVYILGPGAAVTLTGAQSRLIVADETPHVVSIAIDHKTGDMFTWRDGELMDSYPAFVPNAAISPTEDFCLGGSVHLDTGTKPACKLGGVHLLCFPDGLPRNISDLAKLLAMFPRVALTDNAIGQPFSLYVQLTSAPAQSNEVGSGVVFDFVRSLGTPTKDPVAPNGGSLPSRSMWPRLVELAGQAGIYLSVNNAGVGATSILHNWCGVLRAWSNGMTVSRGTYVLSGGNVYKNTTGTKFQTTPVASTVQPTGTSATQTGADSIQWTYMGAARAQDMAGYIYPHTDAYFDPNGFYADALLRVTSGRGYDKKVALVQLGQGDSAFASTKAEFAQGYVNAANYWLSKSVMVEFGVTSYSVNSDAWMTSIPSATAATDPATDTGNGIGGIMQALASFAGDPNVMLGPNLRYGLGVLPIDPALGVPGLRSQSGANVHMNDTALGRAAEIMFARNVELGLLA